MSAQDSPIDLGSPSISFVIMCSAFVFIMTPGVGLLYSALSPKKNALSMIMISMIGYSVVTIQWVLFGFSLVFSETGSPFIGTFEYFGFNGVGTKALVYAAPEIPSIVFAMYQLQFATVTCAIIFGSVAGRIRLLPAILFIFIWTTLVYDPVAAWTWGARGWIRNMACLDSVYLSPCGRGALDFAGGGPVHITSGVAGLAYSMMVGRRRDAVTNHMQPHSNKNIMIATIVLICGWIGFNSGSTLGSTAGAGSAAFVTILSGVTGAITWLLMDYRKSKQLSCREFCTGFISGLIGITPAGGFVAPWAAVIIGAATSFISYYACHIKTYIGIDDTLDGFATHGVGGFVGNIFTGIFAQKWVAYLDGSTIDGGVVDGNWAQIGYQFLGSLSIAVYTFLITWLILYFLNKIPGLHLGYSEEEEAAGMDFIEMGELQVQSKAQAFENNAIGILRESKVALNKSTD
jgi:Amt family ammonium transporter